MTSTNYLHWNGFADPRYGYGSMWQGFMDHVPAGVVMDENASVRVDMQVPFASKGFYDGQWRVNFTMWETTKLPERFRRWIGEFDQVIVPCQHNVAVFGEHHKNVTVVPLGVDHKVWRPVKRAENQRTRFHAGGSLWARKGLDLVVEAFIKAKVDADLYLKIGPQARDVPELSRLPENIKTHRTWMSLPETVEWYGQADCYLAPSRGEGWGLMPLQAMAMGIPTIITASSGQADFAELATIVVPHTPKPTPLGGMWDEADVDALVEAIRMVASEREQFRAQAAARVKDTKQFSWANAAKKLVAATPVGTLLGDVPFKPIDIRYTFQVTRKVTSTINTDTYRFVPGVTYSMSEGVYDVLDQAGYILKEST